MVWSKNVIVSCKLSECFKLLMLQWSWLKLKTVFYVKRLQILFCLFEKVCVQFLKLQNVTKNSTCIKVEFKSKL